MKKVRLQLSLHVADATLLRMVAAMRGKSVSEVVMESVAVCTDVVDLEKWMAAGGRVGKDEGEQA